MGSVQILCEQYIELFTQIVKSLEYHPINDLNGRSHAHVVDDKQGSERFC